MNRILKSIGCLLLAAVLLGGVSAAADTIQFMECYASDEAEYVNLDRIKRKITDLGKVEEFLKKFPNLKKVDMFNTVVTGAQVDELAEMFPGVEFGWTMRIKCKDHDHDIRTDATAFSTLHNKNSPQHTSEDFHILKYCRNLLALDLGHNRITDVSFLNALPNLRVLIIAINQITDISPLANMHDLEYAEIFNNRIADLTPLSGLTKLKDLNISFNSVSDWTPLYSLTGLERLWIYRSSVRGPGTRAMTDKVVADLQANLPNTYLDSTHFPTTGGWRDHPRYDVIHEMFTSGVYKPFE